MCLALTTALSCKKTTNNTTTLAPAQPSFIVTGVSDLQMQNSVLQYAGMNITVQYSDSAQETVTLSLSALPPGIAMDSTWVSSGIPTYYTMLTLFDTTLASAIPGNYPMTLKATTASGKVKSYSFNLKVKAAPDCAGGFTGSYSVASDCLTTSYHDSVTADATVPNKIWFNNMNNTGNKVYGLFSCTSSEITIPTQTVGSLTYSGTGNVSGVHALTLHVSTNGSFCNIFMN